MSGGSSAGPACATGAGLALGGLGTDTSGSLRVPASLCGLVAVRPTHGLVPTAGVVPLAWSYDTVGPLARTGLPTGILLAAASGVSWAAGTVYLKWARVTADPMGFALDEYRRLAAAVAA